jgi:hypothetical protein
MVIDEGNSRFCCPSLRLATVKARFGPLASLLTEGPQLFPKLPPRPPPQVFVKYRPGGR